MPTVISATVDGSGTVLLVVIVQFSTYAYSVLNPVPAVKPTCTLPGVRPLMSNACTLWYASPGFDVRVMSRSPSPL